MLCYTHVQQLLKVSISWDLVAYSSLASHFSLSLELRVVFLIGMCLKQREHWVVMFL